MYEWNYSQVGDAYSIVDQKAPLLIAGSWDSGRKLEGKRCFRTPNLFEARLVALGPLRVKNQWNRLMELELEQSSCDFSSDFGELDQSNCDFSFDSGELKL